MELSMIRRGAQYCGNTMEERSYNESYNEKNERVHSLDFMIGTDLVFETPAG